MMMIVWSKRVVALTLEEEKKNCCVRRTHNCFVNFNPMSDENWTKLWNLLWTFALNTINSIYVKNWIYKFFH
jgi:hypothetical protein